MNVKKTIFAKAWSTNPLREGSGAAVARPISVATVAASPVRKWRRKNHMLQPSASAYHAGAPDFTNLKMMESIKA